MHPLRINNTFFIKIISNHLLLSFIGNIFFISNRIIPDVEFFQFLVSISRTLYEIDFKFSDNLFFELKRAAVGCTLLFLDSLFIQLLYNFFPLLERKKKKVNLKASRKGKEGEMTNEGVTDWLTDLMAEDCALRLSPEHTHGSGFERRGAAINIQFKQISRHPLFALQVSIW